MNPFAFFDMILKTWCDASMAFMRSTNPRKGSAFGLPEPLDSEFKELNDDIKRAQNEIADKIRS